MACAKASPIWPVKLALRTRLWRGTLPNIFSFLRPAIFSVGRRGALFGARWRFITAGAHAPLDELRSLRDESRRIIAALEGKYKTESGVSQLRIKHNGVLGYFIEVAQQHADKLTANRELFRHRQTMAGAMRFSTDELATLASRLAEAAESALALEMTLFGEMCASALEHGEAIAAAADALSVLDVASSLGELAVAQRYARPKIDGSLAFHITRGRHPVVDGLALVASHSRLLCCPMTVICRPLTAE